MGPKCEGTLIPVCRWDSPGKLSNLIKAAQLLDGRTETQNKPRAVRSWESTLWTLSSCHCANLIWRDIPGRPGAGLGLYCSHLQHPWGKDPGTPLPLKPPAQGGTDGAPEAILMMPSWSQEASANPLLLRVPAPGRSKASVLKGDDLTPSHLWVAGSVSTWSVGEALASFTEVWEPASFRVLPPPESSLFLLANSFWHFQW